MSGPSQTAQPPELMQRTQCYNLAASSAPGTACTHDAEDEDTQRTSMPPRVRRSSRGWPTKSGKSEPKIGIGLLSVKVQRERTGPRCGQHVAALRLKQRGKRRCRPRPEPRSEPGPERRSVRRSRPGAEPGTERQTQRQRFRQGERQGRRRLERPRPGPAEPHSLRRPEPRSK